MTSTASTKRQSYDGRSITEMRNLAREYKIPGRSKMDGWQLLKALRAYWHDQRVAAEQAVVEAAKPGLLLRHKSTGTIMRLTSEVIALSNPYGPLCFRAEYVEVAESDLYGGWKGRGRDYARYLNESDVHRALLHMLWQHEAVQCVDCDAPAVALDQRSDGPIEGQRGPKCDRHAGPRQA